VAALVIVTETEPDPFRFAVNVNVPGTNTAVATRLPDMVVDTLLLSELRSAVPLTHLENVLPAATIDIVSPEATGITVLFVTVYASPFIVTATEPVPLVFAVSVKPPVTKNAVATRLPDTVADTLLLSKCKDGVSLTHLENALPVPVAVIDIGSPDAVGITAFSDIVYTAPFIVTSTEPGPFRFADSVKPSLTKNAVATRLPDAVVVTVLSNELRSAVPLTHLENVLPVPVATIEIESPEAIGITSSSVIV
jgi:hypothetical protein